MSEEIKKLEIQNSDSPLEKPGKHDMASSNSPTVSRFILLLAGVVAVLLLIVNNSVTVDRLASDIGLLQSAYAQIEFQNDSLQAELKKLSSAERITRIASEKLGLAYSSQPLDQIKIDKSDLDKAEEQDGKDTRQ